MVEKTILDLPLPDLFHLLTFLEYGDIIHLRATSSQLLRTVPSPKKRRLQVNLVEKEQQFRNDITFLMGSSIRIALTLPLWTLPVVTSPNFSNLDLDVQSLVSNSPERVKSIEIIGHTRSWLTPDPIIILPKTFHMFNFIKEVFPCTCAQIKCNGPSCRKRYFYLSFVKGIPLKFQY